MRRNAIVGRIMLLLSQCVFAVVLGCSGDVGQKTVVPNLQVAVLSVAIDSTTLHVGHSALASATARDSSGSPVSTNGVSWRSLNPSVAQVSLSGQVTGLTAGNAVIQASLSGIAASDTLTVVGPPNLAFSDFNSGALLNSSSTPYFYAYPPADLDFPDDPTGSGRGKVARLHYVRASTSTPADVNRSLTYVHKVGWGETMYFKGDFYCPISDFNQPLQGTGRKLLYWQQHPISDKYGAGRAYFMVLGIAAPDMSSPGKLGIWNGNSDGTLDYPYFFTPAGNTWYTLEVRLTNQSAPGVADGIVTVWVNGNQVYNNSHLAWVPASWIGAPVPGGNGTPLDAADLYFEHFQIGDQVNAAALYDEYRYWDNIAFSTGRIGG